MNSSATFAIVKATVPRYVKALREDLRRDRANAYGLSEPWTLPRLGGDLPKLGLMPPVEGFRDERLFVTPEFVTVLPFPCRAAECDGCTLAPDTWWELRTWVGAIFHDRWYLSMEDIARAWGWPVAKVRKLGDVLFASILDALCEGLPFWSRLRAKAAVRLYYTAVRAFGGIGHRAFKRLEGTGEHGEDGEAASGRVIVPVFLVFLGCLSLCGCSGCAVPQGFEDPATLAPPAGASFTNTVTGAHWEIPARATEGAE